MGIKRISISKCVRVCARACVRVRVCMCTCACVRVRVRECVSVRVEGGVFRVC